MKSKRCPQCQLVNFADAFVCKRCNYQLQNSPSPTQPYNSYNQQSFGPTQPYNSYNQQSYGPYNQPASTGGYNYSSPYKTKGYTNSDSRSGGGRMLVGALVAIGGTVATVISYSAAGGGGRYFIFWGAILFGAIDFLRGLGEMIRGD